MSRKKTHEEYVEELKIKNPDVEVIGEYINANTPILHYCKKHQIEWNISPYHALEGCGCSQCCKEKIGAKNRKIHSQYIEELAQINPHIIVVGTYINNKTPILHRCVIDGYEWMTRPDNVLNSKGCPMCRDRLISNMFRKNHTWYITELSKIHPDIEVVEKYVDYDTPIMHRCKIDGNEWYAKPRNTLRGFGCSECGGYSGEKSISKWLKEHDIKYIQQYRFSNCRDDKPLPFDFYIPKYNLCIEYDGRQHFIPVDFAGKGDEWAKEQLTITQYHDAIKNAYCQTNNISLLRISYLQNIEEELEKILFI
jgi:hypothetical protein